MRLIVLLLTLLMTTNASAGSAKSKKKQPPKSPPAPVEKLCERIEDFSVLMLLNPYDNKDRCFEYWMGGRIQLLGRSVALYGYWTGYEPFAIIDCGEESAPRSFRGYVKGMGAYTYPTVSGFVNTIHDLKVMPQKDLDNVNRIKAEKYDADRLEQEKAAQKKESEKNMNPEVDDRKETKPEK